MALTKVPNELLSDPHIGVGITDTATSAKLAVSNSGIDVTGEVQASSFVMDDSNNTDRWELLRDGNDFTIYNDYPSQSERFRITSGGNVGIGVTPKSDIHSVHRALQIGDAGYVYGYYGADETGIANNCRFTAGGWKYIGQNGSSESTLYYQNNAGSHIFQVAPSGTQDAAISWTTAMTIQNGGDTFFGTDTASNYIWLRTQHGQIDIGGVGTTTDTRIRFLNGNGSVGSIATSGTSTYYTTSSDYRLKENVIPMSGSIDRLKQLKPSRFNFITDADKTVDGFLAHEAQAIVPECVTGEKDAMMMEEYEVTPAVMDGETVVTEAVMGEHEVPDMQGIDQSKLVPLLVGAIQELTARLEALENK